ncbi:MAG: efflux RND transporter permease subunit [Chromatiales bacterium]|nr:efflux RND transporter permease subunit [Chromatiales bacterium]
MNLAALSVRRFVFAAMINAVIVLFGVVAWQGIGIERLPNVDFASISINTTLTGANPDVVDVSITNVLEGAVSSIPGIDSLVSTSSAGRSSITLRFDLEKDIDIAFNEVQAQVSRVMGQLPEQADPPVISKVETGAFPVFWVALTGDRTIQQLNQYARNVVRKRLETVDGVGEVVIGGERTRTIRANLDFERMVAFGVTVQDIIAAFRAEHLLLPGGFLVEGEREQLLKLDLEFNSPEELERMVIGQRNGVTLYLRDVATIEDGLSDFRRIGRYNGRNAVGLGVVKIAGSNTVEISRALRDRIDNEIIPQLPPGLELYISSDDAEYTLELIASLEEHLIGAVIFATLIVLLFLRNFRATLIVAAAIPVSLLGAVLIMYFAGLTLNTITMLALLLLIGVVVDDAIVVLENIQRKRERGERDRARAAVEGANEVLTAIVASTLTLVCIFAVVFFLGGIPGRLFQSFGVVVAGGVLVSLFVALTLTPMLCSRHLDVPETHGPVYGALTRWLDRMERGYARLIERTLRNRWKVVLVTLAIVLTTPLFFRGLGGEFFPPEDEGGFSVFIRTPVGTSIEYGDERMRQLEEVILARPEVLTVFATLGGGRANSVNQGTMYVNLVDRDERSLKQYELIPILRRELAQVPGIQAFPAAFSIVGSARGEALQFALQGPDLDGVATFANELRARMLERPEFVNVDLDLELDLPQVRLRIDRALAAELGLSTREIAEAANVLAGGFDVAKYNDDPGDGERYDIRLKAEGDVDLQDLSKIYLRTPRGDLVRLDTVARFDEILGPATISRLDRQYAAYFFAQPAIPLSEALEVLQAEAAEILPPGYRLRMLGGTEEFANTAAAFAFAFIIALVLVYMVLASQFNSYVQPAVIMIAQPLAIFGGIVALVIGGQTLNLFSMTGLVLLVGLVAKNSILLVDITNQLRAQGKGVDEALLVACPRRLRPILMTSLTIIFAMIVPLLGLGAAVELSRPLATAIVGGLVSSTALTLLVVPAVYSLVENRRASEPREAPAGQASL